MQRSREDFFSGFSIDLLENADVEKCFANNSLGDVSDPTFECLICEPLVPVSNASSWRSTRKDNTGQERGNL